MSALKDKHKTILRAESAYIFDNEPSETVSN
jgi:hypothetical protein